jgi:hypothetical protein
MPLFLQHTTRFFWSIQQEAKVKQRPTRQWLEPDLDNAPSCAKMLLQQLSKGATLVLLRLQSSPQIAV